MTTSRQICPVGDAAPFVDAMAAHGLSVKAHTADYGHELHFALDCAPDSVYTVSVRSRHRPSLAVIAQCVVAQLDRDVTPRHLHIQLPTSP